MSTRCNVVVEIHRSETNPGPLRKFYLYRHHDGYPRCTGWDLLEYAKALQKLTYFSLADAVSGLLFKCDVAGRLLGDYELTVGLHGDVCYVYRIVLYPGSHNHEDARVRMHHSQRGFKGECEEPVGEPLLLEDYERTLPPTQT